jgi:hypothetical protein
MSFNSEIAKEKYFFTLLFILKLLASYFGGYAYRKLRGSVTMPLTAAAAATNGLAKSVLEFGP